MTEPLDIANSLKEGAVKSSRFRPNLTYQKILSIASKDQFHVGRRYRDATLARKTNRLKQLGLLQGGRTQRFGDGCYYQITQLGRDVLAEMVKP